jgi:uncharacterized membrane protein (DUF106 family)
MTLINGVLRAVCDVVLFPFHRLPDWVGLTVVSLVAAVGMLLVFKKTSDQEKLAAVKRRIHACLFEIRLFNDDLRAILRAQLEVLRHNLTYLKLSLVPLFWMIVPFVLVIAQLQFHYGYLGLRPGQTAVVKVLLKEERATRPAASLEAPDGLRVETPPLWIPTTRELAWRIGAEREGDYQIQVVVDGTAETKTVRVSDQVVRLSPLRVAAGFLDELIYPAEAPLPASSPLASIGLAYPGRDIEVLGFGLHWMVVFFVLSMVFAFALRNRFGVTI